MWQYRQALEDESADKLQEQIKAEIRYVIEPDQTYTCFADAARNNSFNREQLQKAFNNIEQRNPLFADLLNTDADILGNAYEYLIGQFASETGKKAGEFYTPQAVSKILIRIANSAREDKRGLSVYAPCLTLKKVSSLPIVFGLVLVSVSLFGLRHFFSRLREYLRQYALRKSISKVILPSVGTLKWKPGISPRRRSGFHGYCTSRMRRAHRQGIR